jgi:hypothetical protein
MVGPHVVEEGVQLDEPRWRIAQRSIAGIASKPPVAGQR